MRFLLLIRYLEIFACVTVTVVGNAGPLEIPISFASHLRLRSSAVKESICALYLIISLVYTALVLSPNSLRGFPLGPKDPVILLNVVMALLRFWHHTLRDVRPYLQIVVVDNLLTSLHSKIFNYKVVKSYPT